MLLRTFLAAFMLTWSLLATAQAIPVTFTQINNKWAILRGGQPYYIKGAGGNEQLPRLVAAGGNSIRTWGVGDDTQALLDQAHSLGLTVMMGLWVGHEAQGFDYNNAGAIASQLEGFRFWVKKYKDHPAILAWAVGNEVDLGYSNLNVWNAVNDISMMIHAEDGLHPTLTVTAGIDVVKAQAIIDRCPDLDFLGINAYGSIGGVGGVLNAVNWNKPYTITEWGTNGQWEVSRTSWGAPLEQSGTEKADTYLSRFQNIIAADSVNCVGSYVFLWGGKFEQTPTWYGMFINGVEEAATVASMQKAWSGNWPQNRPPVITKATIEDRTANQNIVVNRDSNIQVVITASDPDGDPLNYEYVVQYENGSSTHVLQPGATLPGVLNIVQSHNGATCLLRAHENNRNFRLFVYVRDGNNHVTTINLPYQTNLPPLVSSDTSALYVVQDAYVRDGTNASTKHGITDKERLQARFKPEANSGFTRETYLDFDISSINTGFDNITLRLRGSGEPGTQVTAHGMLDSAWFEQSINWLNRPVANTAVLDTWTISTDAEHDFDWNVTEYVRQARYLGKKRVTFVLRHANETDNPTNWHARERRLAPPQLRVDYNGQPLIPTQTVDDLKLEAIYPNPTYGWVNLSYPQLLQAQVADWQIVNQQGQLVANGTVSLVQFSRETRLQLPDLPAGVYYLNTVFGEQQLTTRLLKL
jgi:Secretion system C-terminal sorting domain/Glycosyl hydrolases family 2, TIM barrel domain